MAGHRHHAPLSSCIFTSVAKNKVVRICAPSFGSARESGKRWSRLCLHNTSKRLRKSLRTLGYCLTDLIRQRRTSPSSEWRWLSVGGKLRLTFWLDLRKRPAMRVSVDVKRTENSWYQQHAFFSGHNSTLLVQVFIGSSVEPQDLSTRTAITFTKPLETISKSRPSHWSTVHPRDGVLVFFAKL